MTKSRGSSVMWLTRRHPIARVMFAGVVLLFALAGEEISARLWAQGVPAPAAAPARNTTCAGPEIPAGAELENRA